MRFTFLPRGWVKVTCGEEKSQSLCPKDCINCELLISEINVLFYFNSEEISRMCSDSGHLLSGVSDINVSSFIAQLLELRQDDLAGTITAIV